MSVKPNVITAFVGSNSLGISPRKRIRNKWMHVMQRSVKLKTQ